MSESCVWVESEARLGEIKTTCAKELYYADAEYLGFNFCPYCSKPLEINTGDMAEEPVR